MNPSLSDYKAYAGPSGHVRSPKLSVEGNGSQATQLPVSQIRCPAARPIFLSEGSYQFLSSEKSMLYCCTRVNGAAIGI